jgi:hypothetical protein
MAKQAKGVLKTETLEAVADRGYFSGSEILACHEAGITVNSAQAADVWRQIGWALRQALSKSGLPGHTGAPALDPTDERDVETGPWSSH